MCSSCLGANPSAHTITSYLDLVQITIITRHLGARLEQGCGNAR